jgi:hypothetical protein
MAFILLGKDAREYLERAWTLRPNGGGEVIVPRIENKVVVHFRDGRILKGYTYDFHPDKTVFHLIDAQNRKEVTEVSTSHTKAVFFVKTFEGNRDHPGPDAFCMESFKNSPGLKVKVTFYDEEVMYGSTHGYAPNRKGFFISPANREINNDRVFVIRDSTLAVETWKWERAADSVENGVSVSRLDSHPADPSLH